MCSHRSCWLMFLSNHHTRTLIPQEQNGSAPHGQTWSRPDADSNKEATYTSSQPTRTLLKLPEKKARCSNKRIPAASNSHAGPLYILQSRSRYLLHTYTWCLIGMEFRPYHLHTWPEGDAREHPTDAHLDTSRDLRCARGSNVEGFKTQGSFPGCP